MKLKLDEHGNAVLQDGKPVYVQDDGKEIAFDAAGTVQTIGRLTGDVNTLRERAEAAEAKYKPFDGIEDPAAARTALEKMKNIDHKKLIDAGELEQVRQEIGKGYQAQLDEERQRSQVLEKQLREQVIGSSFASSVVIRDKLAIPADLVQAKFGSAFRVEEGRVVAHDVNGNKIYSQTRLGELADFDEALERLVEQYPHKDHILKGSGASGGGSKTGGGNGGGQSGPASLADCKTDAERVAYLDKVVKQ